MKDNSKSKQQQNNDPQQVCEEQSNQEQHLQQGSILSSESPQESSSSFSSDDEIKPKPVFELIEEEHLLSYKQTKRSHNNEQANLSEEDVNDEGLHEDQREAFLYLLSVRKEKKTLLEEKKQRKTLNKKILKHQEKHLHLDNKHKEIQNIQINQSPIPSSNNDAKSKQYIDCILKNFLIVVQNVKYLIKTDSSYANNNKKLNTKLYDSIKIQKQPQLYELIRLTVGQVQDAIRKLSLELTLDPKVKKQQDNHLEGLNQGLEKKKMYGFQNYALWIYSLLALHQAWSAYKHFPQLAEINFILINQVQSLKTLSPSETKSLLILLTLMVKIFEQKHLTSHLSQTASHITNHHENKSLIE